MSAAIKKYVEFHQHEPNKVGPFHADLEIPARCTLAGAAVSVMYRSDKLNPTTSEDEGWIDYIHEHGAGVNVYRCDDPRAQGRSVAVPAPIRNARELTWLGDCLGFMFRTPIGKEVEAHGTKPLPELYATPDGRGLLVIQGKRKLLALFWGGKLGVEARGIVH